MQRILVIGVSGAGKSTLARALATRLPLPFTPTDELYWGPNWQLVSSEALRERLIELARAESWVLDGNFDDLRDIVWARADTIVWLDYPRYVTVPRLVGRNLGWFLSRQLVWSGNRMNLTNALSEIRHGSHSFAYKREHYPVWLRGYPKAHIPAFVIPGPPRAGLKASKGKSRMMLSSGFAFLCGAYWPCESDLM